jgi:hypothetical protein
MAETAINPLEVRGIRHRRIIKNCVITLKKRHDVKIASVWQSLKPVNKRVYRADEPEFERTATKREEKRRPGRQSSVVTNHRIQ